MSINQHLEEMKDILNIIQAFLDEPSDGEKFPNLKLKFDEYQISNSKYKTHFIVSFDCNICKLS